MASENPAKSRKTDPADKSGAKTPLRRRGHARVAGLLQAATAVFAEKGFDGATMTEIAARAGASIGSLYQFFPTKEALGDALHRANADDLLALLQDLAITQRDRPAAALGDALFGGFLDFLNQHPAFGALADRRDPASAAKKEMRARLREGIADLFSAAQPPVARAEAERLAVIVLHLLKTTISIRDEAALDDGAAILGDLKAMLRGHLGA